MGSLAAALTIVVSLAARAVALNPPAKDAEPPLPNHEERLGISKPFSGVVLRVGYDGLGREALDRDLERLNNLLGQHAEQSRWPTRDAYVPGSLTGFPAAIEVRTASSELVPLYMIVNPDEFDRAWSRRNNQQRPPAGAKGSDSTGRHRETRDQYERLSGEEAMSVTLHIEPFDLRAAGAIRIHWPSWADAALPGRFPQFPDLGTRRWSALSTTGVGFPNALIPALRGFKSLKQIGVFETYRVSDSAWRIVPPKRPVNVYETQRQRGELVFPLWESIGTVRSESTDPWADKRNGPLSAHVESPDFEWRFEGRDSLVFTAPISKEFKFIREYVVLPETFAKEPVPIMSVYKAKTWKPFAEDYVFRVGPPTTTEGLRAVCVFMTATDEQLRDVVKAMCRAERAKVEPKTESNPANPSPTPGTPK